MVAWLRSWISPAHLEEDIRRRASLLNLMALAALLLSLVVNASLILTLIPDGMSQGLVIAITTLLVSFLWVGVILYCSRRGWVSVGSHILLWGGIVLVLGANLTDPNTTMEDPSWSLFCVVVVAAALLLGTRGMVIFAAITILLYLVANLAEFWGWIARAPIRPAPNIPYRVAIVGSVLMTLALLAWLFGSGLERALKRARQQTAELAEAKAHLETTQAYLEQTVQRTVTEYTAFAQRVAAGDLTSRLNLADAGSPLLALGRSLNAMVEGLQQISVQVHATVADLTALAAGIQAICAQQSSGADEESRAITAASSTISEVRTIAEQTAERAQGVAAVAQRTAAVARSGQEAVADAVAGMGQVKERVQGIANHMETLSEQMEAVGQIIITVGEVTTRSKLLALNAAVEAARAGEAGKSFTVVAGEMRNLADQSRAAAERVGEIIAEIQQGVQVAAATTADGVLRADAGVVLAGKAGESIEKLAAEVTDSTAAAVQIAAAAGQQMAGMEQIFQAMENIRQVTAQGLTSTRQAQQSAGELNRLADRLREIVAQYRL